MHTPRRATAAVPAVLALFALLAMTLSSAASAQEPPAIDVLSTRSDQVVGGDALIAVTGLDAPLRVSFDGGPAAELATTDHDGVLQAKLTGLRLGADRAPLTQLVTVTDVDGDTASLEITNHPTEGPVFSGEHIQPWSCSGSAYDENCNYKAIAYSFSYVPAGGSSLQAIEDPTTLEEGDWATTTTDQGNEVPFVVRFETGALDRDQYRIASLVDPADPHASNGAAPYAGYNGKLVLNHGASCDTNYGTASAPGVSNQSALARGFAVASHALNNAGHNCNLLTQAESLVMTKERVAEQLGAIRYTIGYGCSGGALVQQQVANAYPGIYQGISPACSFADAWSTAQQYIDYVLLRDYFEQPWRWGPGVVWTPQGIEAAYGHPNVANPVTFTTAIPNSGEPTRSCTSQDPGVYDEESNPDGVRCTLHDYMVNAFGIHGDLDGDGEVDFPVTSSYDAATDTFTIDAIDYPAGTSDAQKAEFEDDIVDHTGDVIAGFARRPYDNAGILYGLSGVLDGTMTPAQFVDLNVQVGGGDYDLNTTPQRVVADQTAVERIFRTGAVNSGEHMDQVAIIDRRGPDPGAFHDVYRTYVMRERLFRSNGHADNQVLWQGPVALLGDATFETDSIFALDAWLAEVEQQGGFDAPGLEDRIREARTAAGIDHRCTNGAGDDLPYSIDVAGTPAGRLVCDTVAEDYTAPRIQAGAPLSDDHIACQLKPLNFDEFRFVDHEGNPTPVVIPFSAVEQAALRQVFPDGVCDYSLDPAHLQIGEDGLRTQAWLDYGDSTGTIFGGARLADAPTSLAGVAAESDEAGRSGLTDPYLVERVTGS